MSAGRYGVGTKLIFMDPQSGESFKGEVVPNEKLPEDICVTWETGLFSSYDKIWLDKFTQVLDQKDPL